MVILPIQKRRKLVLFFGEGKSQTENVSVVDFLCISLFLTGFDAEDFDHFSQFIIQSADLLLRLVVLGANALFDNLKGVFFDKNFLLLTLLLNDKN